MINDVEQAKYDRLKGEPEDCDTTQVVARALGVDLT